MVLEESLHFYDEEDANRFIQFLRQKNCRAQKVTDSSLFEESMLKGKIGDIMRWAGKEAERGWIQDGKEKGEEGSQKQMGDDVLFPDLGGLIPPIPGIGRTSYVYSRMVDNLASIRNYVADIMDRFNPGDFVWTQDEMDRIKRDIASSLEEDEDGDEEEEGDEWEFGDPGEKGEDKDECVRVYGDDGISDNNEENDEDVEDGDPGEEDGGCDDDEGSEGLRRKIAGAIFQMDCRRTMESNGIVESLPEGLRLVRKIDPDDLIVERRAWNPDDIDSDILNEHDVVLEHHLVYETETRVLIDPRIYVLLLPGDVETFLEGCEADHDDVDTLVHNMYLKNIAIECIMNVITAHRRISLPDLTRELGSIAPFKKGDEFHLVVDFSPEFITAIISDMRKIGIIEGNDRKIRAA